MKVVLGVWELSSTVADKNVFVSAARKTQISFVNSLTLSSKNKVFWLHHYGSLEWPKLLLNSLKSCAAKWENAWRIKVRFPGPRFSHSPRYKMRGDSRASLENICLRQMFEEWWQCVSSPVRGIFTSPPRDRGKRQKLEYFSPLRREPLSGGWVLTVRCGSNSSVMSWNQLKGFRNCFLIRASAVGVSHHISLVSLHLKGSFDCQL